MAVTKRKKENRIMGERKRQEEKEKGWRKSRKERMREREKREVVKTTKK